MAKGKITLQTLSEIMANNTGRSKTSTEMFVRAFFATLKDALAKDNIVKIKGLGTFKMVVVNARESVNVNTGKRVSIAEYNKITFTPDKNLKDKVNRPFSQFETVVIDDEEISAVVENSLEPSENTTEGALAPTENSADNSNCEIVDTKDSTMQTDSLPDEDKVDPDAPEAGTDAKETPYPCELAENDQQEATGDNHENGQINSHNKQRLWWIIPVIIVLVGITYVLGYMRIIDFSFLMGEDKENIAVTSSGQKTTKSKTKEKTTEEDTLALKNDTISKFPQIKGGKYLITGIKTYRKIKPDYDVTRYCLQIYGNKDCLPYVLLLNNIKEDDIKVGKVLKFPTLIENNIIK